MQVWRFILALAVFGASVPVEAQVHKCVDASGRATFSDTPCPTSAKTSNQVLGREATETRIEPEDAGYRRNMESINRSRAALQGSVDVVTRQSQGPEGGGAAIMDGPSSQQVRSTLQGSGGRDDCETTSTRKSCIGGSRSANPNWSPRRGYYGGGGAADQQFEIEQERLRQAAAAKAAQPPAMLTNCNAGGCWDIQGNRYNSTGNGSRLVKSEGRTCQANGKFVSCN